jgi:tetratricopeptide (TPR) repeat protein
MNVPSTFLALTALCFGLVSTALAGDEKAFEKDLNKARAELHDRKWDDARERLIGLLEQHAREPYAIDRFPGIREDLRRCAFWEQHDEPKLETLLSGTVKGKARVGGSIKITYGPGQFDDFKKFGAGYVHPVTFRGPYTIELTWSGRWGGEYPGVVTGLGTENAIGVSVGLQGGVAEVDRMWRWLETFPIEGKLKLTRAEGKIDVWADGKKVFSKKERGLGLGQFSVSNLEGAVREFELTISGKTQKSWLQGVLDEAVRETYEAFEEEYDETAALPAWLMESGDGFEKANGSTYPGPYLEKQEELWAQGLKLIEDENLTKLKSFVPSLDDRDCTKAFCKFWEARLHEILGEYEKAAKDCDKVLEIDDTHVESLLLRVRLLQREGERETAIEKLGDLFVQMPLNTRIAQELVLSLMIKGDVSAAKNAVRQAFTAGAPITSLSSTLGMIGKADRGPDWGESFEYESRHYRVRSDIDVQLCKAASKVLENSLKAYKKDLGREPRDDRIYPVMLFSGEAGYQAYTEDLLGGRAENTAGLFSPALKQLLIWNLPDREQMFTTVQHEGFHQYLDSIMDDAPRWLNEGLAEYYEVMDLSGLVTDHGTVNKNHLSLLRSKGYKPLKELLHYSPAEFYVDGIWSYAQSWSFVHFLLHSTEENRALFDKLIDLLCEGRPVKAAVNAVFSDLDQEQLQSAWKAHVKQL